MKNIYVEGIQGMGKSTLVNHIYQEKPELHVCREGDYYRVTKENDDTIMLVSHGGSSSAVLSHILNIPFPFVCQTIRPYFTAITVVSFKNKIGELVAPKFELVNDARHIEKITPENMYCK